MAFTQVPIPTYTEAQMLAQLPTAGNFYFFYNSDKGGDLYAVDSAGTFTFVASSDDDCCTCKLSELWLCGINRALATGQMSPSQYASAIVTGFTATQTKTSPGNCTITVGAKISRFPPTSVVITTSSTSVAVGATQQLGIAALPEGSDPSVFWVSSDPTKGTVDQSGKVTGVAAGVTTITAFSIYDSLVKDTQDITVTP